MEIPNKKNDFISKLNLRQLKKNFSEKLNNKPLKLFKDNLNDNKNFINFINQKSTQNINNKKKKNK